jgi:hypothetical protein
MSLKETYNFENCKIVTDLLFQKINTLKSLPKRGSFLTEKSG